MQWRHAPRTYAQHAKSRGHGLNAAPEAKPEVKVNGLNPAKYVTLASGQRLPGAAPGAAVSPPPAAPMAPPKPYDRNEAVSEAAGWSLHLNPKSATGYYGVRRSTDGRHFTATCSRGGR